MDDKAIGYGIQINIFSIEIISDLKLWATISQYPPKELDEFDFYIQTPIECVDDYFIYSDDMYDSFIKDNDKDIVDQLTKMLFQTEKIRNDSISKKTLLKNYFECLSEKIPDIIKSMGFEL